MRAVRYETEWGPGWLGYRDDGVLGVVRLPGEATPGPEDRRPDPLASALEAYFAGGPLPDPPSWPDGTALTRRIHAQVHAIPRGTTMTYAEVAVAVGRPGAARAVGTVMAANPIPPLIPCHRVVGSDGSLRGYRGGINLKAALLRMEGGR